MPKRWWFAVFVALVVGALLAPAGFAQAPIKIGVIEPLSGPVAASGNFAASRSRACQRRSPNWSAVVCASLVSLSVTTITAGPICGTSA